MRAVLTNGRTECKEIGTGVLDLGAMRWTGVPVAATLLIGLLATSGCQADVECSSSSCPSKTPVGGIDFIIKGCARKDALDEPAEGDVRRVANFQVDEVVAVPSGRKMCDWFLAYNPENTDANELDRYIDVET